MGNDTQLHQVQVGPHSATVSIREVANDAPPLLMLHGVGLEHQRWGRTRELLDRTTVAFDVRTEHLGRRPSMRTFAKFTAKLLTQLGHPRVDVVGLSWGGMAAQQLVHDHPAQVRRMVLVSTSPGFMGVPTRPSSMKILMSTRRSEDQLPELIRNLYNGDFVDNPALAHELGLIRTVDEAAYHRQLWALFGWTSSLWLPSLRKKTLILHAENDPVFPYPNAVLMRSLIRGASLRKIPGGGHLFVLTRPERSAQNINEFLDRSDEAFERPRPPPGSSAVDTGESRSRDRR
jgi:pimeloyl-ACP methyl ester carboxylesterase